MSEETRAEQTYHLSAAPWWLAGVWVLYFLFTVAYLLTGILVG